MERSPTPPRRPRQTAMKDAGGSDDQRERARSGRGVKSSDRPASPPRGSRQHQSRPRYRPVTKPESSSHHRSSDRSHDRHARPSSVSSRRPSDPDDLIPRYRATKGHQTELDDRSHRSRSRGRGDADPPSSAKRYRSRSLSPGGPDRKKHRKDRSPTRRGQDYGGESRSRKRRRHSSHDRRRSSPHRGSRSYRSPIPDDDYPRGKQASPSSFRSSRDPDLGLGRVAHDSRQSTADAPRYSTRSRSPASDSWRMSSHRSVSSSHPRDNHFDSSSNIAAGDRIRVDQDRRPSHRQQPPRSPRSHRDRGRPEDTTESHHSSRSGGPDEDMASRGNYRGGYTDSVHSRKPHYGNDPPGYNQSPQHGGSYQTSPSQSPYGTGRGSWSGPQYSQQHHPPHYHPSGGGYGTSNGPPDHYHQNSPPYAAPSGPGQYSQPGYRGGPRGSGFRGGPYAGRGGSHRAPNFKNAQWTSGKPNHFSRGQRQSPDDGSSGRQSISGAPIEESERSMEDADMDNKPIEPMEDSRTDNSNKHDREGDGMAPPNRPPSGPASQPNSSGKFSFAFKTSSKPIAATPKPEISSKFNAAPQRRVSPPRDDRDRDRDREPPRSAPREPASARSRPEFRQPPEGPRAGPRMRKVKKVMKRPKPRPTLPADLIESESVFFRKPGNESVVGSGTYGKVFKGLNVYTEGLVALKRIRMEGERDGFPVTAVREIKLLQSLRHTNIVNLQEVMVEKNDCFMVFEYLSHDLTGLLHHPTFKLDSSQKKHLAKQLFEGLDYLHERGVLHRDIKAANILVSSDGILKLADFGLARFYAKRHQLDYTNRVITIWYRSPELLLGETKYTAAVDVWSAACVMVEIFTKHAIFAGDGTELSQLDKIYNILGTPNLQDWPGLVDMAWFELLRPTAKRKNVFADKYKDRLTPAAFELLAAMFYYDPTKRPTAAEVLQHHYFTTEEPLPKQAIELAAIDGDWHEFESKALRKENERRDREARKAAKDGSREKDKKRPMGSNDDSRDAKRQHVDDEQATESAKATEGVAAL